MLTAANLRIFNGFEKHIEEDVCSLKSGDSALTDVTLVDRYYKPRDDTEDAVYTNAARDVSKTPDDDILDGLPTAFQPNKSQTPYGHAWDEDRYRDMCEYIRTCNNIKAICVMVHYWNRFRVYVKRDRRFFEVEYNPNTGYVSHIVKEWNCAAEENVQERLPNAKKKTDTVPNLWKEIRGRPRVFKRVCKPAPPRRTILSGSSTFNEFFGFKAEIEYDLETSNDRLDISAITNHIEQRYFEGNVKYIRWFKRWLYEILWLKRRTGAAVVMYGEQGTGKSCIVDFIGRCVMGKAYAKTKNFEGIGDIYQNKLLINIDEVSNAKKHDSLLKDIVAKNNLWLTTNEKQRFLYITDSDKYFVKEIKRSLKTEEFNDLYTCIKNPRAPAEFMLWVKEAETYDDVADVTRIPMTPEKESRIADYTDLTYYWIQNSIDVFVPGQVVEQKAYVDMYNSRHGHDFRASPHMFSKVFKTLGFEVVKTMPIKIKTPNVEHMISVMKAMNKWNDCL